MDKPGGLTSHDVVARVRRALRTRAVGHTGTLDPFATGLLVLLVGRATRLARFVEQQAKTYLATARLGLATTTDDATGMPLAAAAQVAQRDAGPPSRSQVAEVLDALRGPQRQRPPAFSAKHVAGERAYARARRGETVELAEVPIVVHTLDLVRYEYPELQFRATVSAGTYVRALARELGERLGTGAHLAALRREAIGPLLVEQAVPLEGVTPAALRPPLAVLGHLPRLEVSADEAHGLGFGRALTRQGGVRATATPDGAEQAVAAVASDDRLIAVGRIAGGVFEPTVVLEPAG